MNVSEESQAERHVLHELADDLDHKDHQSDGNQRNTKLRSREVAEVAEDAVCAHAFELDIAYRDQRHSQVKAEVRRWGKGEEERQQVARENDHPKRDDHRDIFSSARSNHANAHAL